MRPKSFHHFVIAGVIAMASAGLVSVGGPSLAGNVRVAQYEKMPEEMPPSAIRPALPFMIPFLHTAPGANQGSDQEKLIRMREEMIKRSADLTKSQESMGGQANQTVEKDMTKQFSGMGVGSSVMKEIMQQLRADDGNAEEDPCEAVDMVEAEMLDQISAQSAERLSMYTTRIEKSTSAAVQKVLQKRIDAEAKKVAGLEKKLATKVEQLRAKYGCDQADESL